MRSRVLLLVGGLGVAACAKASGSSTFADAGAPDAAAEDSPNGNPYADAGMCTANGLPGIPCPRLLSDFCSVDAGAYTDWACGTTLQTVQTTPPCHASTCPYSHVSFESCGDTQEVWNTEVDTGIGASYDTETGQLVAILGLADPGIVLCTAGPPCVVVPAVAQCAETQALNCCPADGGGD